MHGVEHEAAAGREDLQALHGLVVALLRRAEGQRLLGVDSAAPEGELVAPLLLEHAGVHAGSGGLHGVEDVDAALVHKGLLADGEVHHALLDVADGVGQRVVADHMNPAGLPGSRQRTRRGLLAAAGHVDADELLLPVDQLLDDVVGALLGFVGHVRPDHLDVAAALLVEHLAEAPDALDVGQKVHLTDHQRHLSGLVGDHLHQLSRGAARPDVVVAHEAHALRARNVAVEGDDGDALRQSVDALANPLILDGHQHDAADVLALQPVDAADLILHRHMVHRELDDLHAVGGGHLGGLVDAGIDVDVERVRLAGHDRADAEGVLHAAQRLRHGVGLVVQLLHDGKHARTRFRIDTVATVNHTINRAPGNICDFCNLLERTRHSITVTSVIPCSCTELNKQFILYTNNGMSSTILTFFRFFPIRAKIDPATGQNREKSGTDTRKTAPIS